MERPGEAWLDTPGPPRGGLVVKRIFICSPYSAPAAEQVERNVRLARALCKGASQLGCVPFAPHLLYTQILNDRDPGDRRLGISMGLAFLEACDEVWVYDGQGVSEGMRGEIEYARRLGKPVVMIGGPEAFGKLLRGEL